METNDKHSDEWLDWLEDADTAGDVGRPADEKELERLRQAVHDCNGVFARRLHAAPDTDRAWEDFRRRTAGRHRRRRNGFLVWGGWTGMAACLAVLLWVFFTRPQTDGQAVLMFTAVHDERGVTLSADNGTVWELDKPQAAEALEEQGIRTDGRVADYREVERVEMQTLTVPRGKDFHLVLADGTEVWVNAESCLHYPSRFTGGERRVRVEGEAYFRVARDERHPFVVETTQFSTRVLGTEFNLQAYTDAPSHVTLVRGSVVVQDPDGREEVNLQPGQEFTLKPDGSSELHNVDPYARTQWKEGYFYFDHASLEEILRGLGRWYNVDIEVNADPELLDFHLHYVADRRGTLEEALKRLNGLQRLTAVLEGNRIVLR